MHVSDRLLDALRQTYARVLSSGALDTGAVESPFQAIVDELPDSLLVLDADGRILYANRAWLGFRGMDLADALGRNIVDLAGDEERRRLASQRRRLLRELRPDQPLLTMEFSHLDGVVIEVTYKGWFSPEGELLATTALARDRTQAHRYEEALEAANRSLEESNRDLRDFAHIASHDLQEPLRKISAFSERLIDRYATELDDRGVDYLTRVVAASGRMQQLIQSLLDYSRVNSRGQDLVPVDLGPIVSEVLGDLEVAIEDAAASVSVDSLPTVPADPTQMHQLFLNLIGNAIKFRDPDRPVVVKITAIRVGHRWQVRVADNGIGFEPEYAEKIFGPFQRLHTRSAYDGSGIGLSVCRRIVERHGGRISASSAPGSGAKFVVELPGADAPRRPGPGRLDRDPNDGQPVGWNG